MEKSGKHRGAIRLLALGLIIGLGAYWAGSRYGQHSPLSVHALPSGLPADEGPTALDPTEAQNVRIYKQASPAIANIVTRAVQYDFFFDAVPVEGAGSGFVIDTDGHILTNYHVVQGAETIEVTLGDQSRYKAKYIGADTRNDIALLQIDPKGRRGIPAICWWVSACLRSATPSVFKARSRLEWSARSDVQCKPAKAPLSTKRSRPMQPSTAGIPAARC